MPEGNRSTKATERKQATGRAGLKLPPAQGEEEPAQQCFVVNFPTNTVTEALPSHKFNLHTSQEFTTNRGEGKRWKKNIDV